MLGPVRHAARTAIPHAIRIRLRMICNSCSPPRHSKLACREPTEFNSHKIICMAETAGRAAMNPFSGLTGEVVGPPFSRLGIQMWVARLRLRRYFPCTWARLLAASASTMTGVICSSNKSPTLPQAQPPSRISFHDVPSVKGPGSVPAPNVLDPCGVRWPRSQYSNIRADTA